MKKTFEEKVIEANLKWIARSIFVFGFLFALMLVCYTIVEFISAMVLIIFGAFISIMLGAVIRLDD